MSSGSTDVSVVVAKAAGTQFKVNVGVLASNRLSAVAHFLFAFECTIFVGVFLLLFFLNVMNPLIIFT